MIITEIMISEFGCLRNRVIRPEAGMNVIFGENESGKSTVMLFIKFMLYGLGRRSPVNSERERSVSWQGHTAAGSMTFIHGDSTYRIERRYTEGEKSGNEKLTVICLDSGELLSRVKTPGEYFLGVPREIFESSSCVGQMRSAHIDGEKTGAGIRNMLTSADESVDTAKIIKGLDAVRVGYLHKTKKGGSLYECEQELNSLKQKLKLATEAKLSLDEQVKRVERARSEYEQVKREYAIKDALVGEMNKVELLNRFAALRAVEKENSELREQVTVLKREALRTEYFPTRAHIAELKHGARSLREAETLYAKRSAETREQAKSGYDGELARLGEELEQKGGAEAVTAFVNAKRKKSRAQGAVVAAVWVTFAILSLVGAIALGAGYVWGAAFFSFVAPAVICTATAVRAQKRLKSEIKAIADEYSTEPEMLSAKLEACVKALAVYRAYVKVYARLEAELDLADSALKDSREALGILLAKTAPDISITAENAESEAKRLEVFTEHLEKLENEEKALNIRIETEKEALSSYDEQQLKEGLTVDISEVTSVALSEAQRQRSFLEARRASFEQRILNETGKLSELRALSEDPFKIADEFYELQAKYEEDKSFYDALVLAMETIEEAGRAMSGSVMPLIAKRASEIMSRVSKNKYTSLHTTGDLSVSLDSDGFGIRSEYLSGGTRDAAYLALRLSLWSRIYGSELPPLMLDEALCQLDDSRAEALLSMLCELAEEDMQCLCFTSHKREAEICERIGAKYNLISL